MEFEAEIKEREQTLNDEKRLAEERDRFFIALEQLAKNQLGRVLLKQILVLSGFGTNAYAGDPIQTAYNLGRQSLGVDLRQLIINKAGYDTLRLIEEQPL